MTWFCIDCTHSVKLAASISFIWSLRSFDQQPNHQSLFISGSFNVRTGSMPLIARIDYISTLNLHSKNHLNSKRHLSRSPGGEELVKLTVTLNKWLQKNLILLIQRAWPLWCYWTEMCLNVDFYYFLACPSLCSRSEKTCYMLQINKKKIKKLPTK